MVGDTFEAAGGEALVLQGAAEPPRTPPRPSPLLIKFPLRLPTSTKPSLPHHFRVQWYELTPILPAGLKMRRGRTPGRGTRRGGTAAPAASTEPTDGPAVAEASTPATLTPTAGGSTALPAPPATSAVTRGGATARATRGPSIGRFRPKNVRRDEAERDNLARQEEQKASERAAAERRARGRSRFRSKRSRGDAMGSRGGFGRANPTASGPFSAGMSAGSSSISFKLALTTRLI